MKYYGDRGLRSWWSKYKGASFMYKLERLRYELHLAWERAWYGYSWSDIWNLDTNMAEQMSSMLKSFKDDPIFILIDPDTGAELSKEEADKIYSRIVKCIEYGDDEDLCYKELYGISQYEDTELERKDFIERYLSADELRKTYKHEAFELLDKYWDQLWY